MTRGSVEEFECKQQSFGSQIRRINCHRRHLSNKHKLMEQKVSVLTTITNGFLFSQSQCSMCFEYRIYAIIVVVFFFIKLPRNQRAWLKIVNT